MLFSSPIFLFIFLPLVLTAYYFANKKYRNYILLVFSLLFYSWGEPVFIFLMIFSIISNFIFSKIIYSEKSHVRKKTYLIIGIVVNLSILIIFKYSDFFIGNFNALWGTNFKLLHLLLPLGISFYTFHSLSYLIDVYRGKVEASDSLCQVALYISFFPQLIAGPIVRYKDIYQQIREREESWIMFGEGIRIFIYGLSMKLLIANFAGQIADTIFNQNVANLSIGTAWLGALAYSLQIFFDFAGYSTMAIGLAKMFGFKFLENFNYPYIATSMKDFWQRWHISLSAWFKDYLYIPLGGNRKGKRRTILNQFVVFGLVGLWHGASWTFIFWGLYHGTLLSLEKINFIKKIQSKLPFFLAIPITFILILIGWVFFRSTSIGLAFEYIKSMFRLGGTISYALSRLDYLVIILGIILSIPWHNYLKWKNNAFINNFLPTVTLTVLLIIDIIVMISSTYNPFIYFRF